MCNLSSCRSLEHAKLWDLLCNGHMGQIVKNMNELRLLNDKVPDADRLQDGSKVLGTVETKATKGDDTSPKLVTNSL